MRSSVVGAALLLPAIVAAYVDSRRRGYSYAMPNALDPFGLHVRDDSSCPESGESVCPDGNGCCPTGVACIYVGSTPACDLPCAGGAACGSGTCCNIGEACDTSKDECYPTDGGSAGDLGGAGAAPTSPSPSSDSFSFSSDSITDASSTSTGSPSSPPSSTPTPSTDSDSSGFAAPSSAAPSSTAPSSSSAPTDTEVPVFSSTVPASTTSSASPTTNNGGGPPTKLSSAGSVSVPLELVLGAIGVVFLW